MTKRKALNRHLRVQVLARDNYKCLMCGRAKDAIALEVDHIRALADGGTDELHNLATLCKDCNLGKSAYRFNDYTNVGVIPANLEADFKFVHDAQTGDFEQYHLYLYFRGTPTGKFHHTWKISGTDLAISSNPDALTQRLREEQSEHFLVQIRRQLIAEAKRLVRNEEGVCKVDG